MAIPIISQFVQCFAVSKTSDPIFTSDANGLNSSYYTWAYGFGTKINDYDKISVWPDGYYVNWNIFDASSGNFFTPRPVPGTAAICSAAWQSRGWYASISQTITLVCWLPIWMDRPRHRRAHRTTRWKLTPRLGCSRSGNFMSTTRPLPTPRLPGQDCVRSGSILYAMPFPWRSRQLHSAARNHAEPGFAERPADVPAGISQFRRPRNPFWLITPSARDRTPACAGTRCGTLPGLPRSISKARLLPTTTIAGWPAWRWIKAGILVWDTASPARQHTPAFAMRAGKSEIPWATWKPKRN